MRALILLSALALVACGRPGSATPTAAHKAVEFKKGQGLLVDVEAAKFIGLEKQAVESAGNTPVIPSTAILETSEGSFAYVVNGPRLLRTAVQLGPVKGATVAVTDGLLEGDVIAVAGVKYLWFAELQSVKGGVGCADGH